MKRYGLRIRIDPKLSSCAFQAKDKKRNFLRITFNLIFKILIISYLNKHSFFLIWFACEDLTLDDALAGGRCGRFNEYGSPPACATGYFQLLPFFNN